MILAVLQVHLIKGFTNAYLRSWNTSVMGVKSRPPSILMRTARGENTSPGSDDLNALLIRCRPLLKLLVAPAV